MGIRIELDNPNRSYFAGQLVGGRVIIQNEKPDKVKQVTIFLHGRGRVHWTEQKARSSRRGGFRTVHYIAEEDYVSLLGVLAGDGENSMILPEGTTSYPFNFLLPTNLPSSFNSHVGQVSYILRGEVRKSSFFKFNDHAKLPFTVNGIFDLNLQPGALVPQQCQQTKASNFWVGRKGKLDFLFSLPTRSGFVPGEAIDFKANITNGSNKKITWVTASLQQVTKFYAKGKCKTKKSPVSLVQGPKLDEGENKIWEGNLLIPAIPPTKLGSSCQIIDLQYFIYLDVSMSGLSSSRTAKLPVMIGTIPLRYTFGNFQPIPQNVPGIPLGMPMPYQGHPGLDFTSANSAMGPMPSSSKALLPSQNMGVNPSAPPVFPHYPDLPPPSYAEAVGSEGFTWNPEGNAYSNEDESDQVGVKRNDNDHNPSPSAPDIDDFVPNYITYNRIL